MCFEKVQRLMMAAMIALGAALAVYGIGFGFILLGFIAAMVLIWGVADFCPSSWFLSKIGLPACYKRVTR